MFMDISFNPKNKTLYIGPYFNEFLGMRHVNSQALFSVVYSTDMQDLWISVKEMIERISAKERAKGHDQFIVALQ